MYKNSDPGLTFVLYVGGAMLVIILVVFASFVAIPIAIGFGIYKWWEYSRPIPVYEPALAPIEEPQPIITHDDLRKHGAAFGPTGHGKSQLLLGMIAAEIHNGTPMVILDSTGAFVEKLGQLKCFYDDERLIILDPTDALPPAFNFFHMPAGISEARKAELFQYVFAAIDRALTPKMQGAIPYLLRLMAQIPDATLLTLADVLTETVPRNGTSRFQPYIDQLDPTTQRYFATIFNDRQEMAQTRSNIATRIMEVLSDGNFHRMFTAPETRFDINAAIEERSVVVVNTSQNALGDKGSSVFGRYIIALCRAAAFAREAVPERDRHLALLIIDEASEFLDDTTERILSQTRQFGLGMFFATQYLDKIPATVRSAVFGNVAILAAGGLGHGDASALAREMRVKPEDIMGMKPMHWLVHVKGKEIALLAQRYGTIDDLPRMNAREQAIYREFNRQRVGVAEEPRPPPEAAAAKQQMNETSLRDVDAPLPSIEMPHVAVGDLVQVTVNGVDRFSHGTIVTEIREKNGRMYVMVEGLREGAPLNQVRPFEAKKPSGPPPLPNPSPLKVGDHVQVSVGGVDQFATGTFITAIHTHGDSEKYVQVEGTAAGFPLSSVRHFAAERTDVDFVINTASHIEALFRRRGATGIGLHDLVETIMPPLPPEIVNAVRVIASARNPIAHGQRKRIYNRARFIRCAQDVENYLKQNIPEQGDLPRDTEY